MKRIFDNQRQGFVIMITEMNKILIPVAFCDQLNRINHIVQTSELSKDTTVRKIRTVK
jgi:hypothetical protein